MTRRKRAFLLAAASAAALFALSAIVAVVTVRSDWFKEKVRLRMIAEAERATGGRVELGGYSFDPARLRARVDNFVLRGKEGPDQPPLFHAASVEVGLRIVSLFKRDVDLASIVVRSPRIHIIVYEDNSTNFPSPARRGPRRDPVDFLLKLAVERFAIDDGVLDFDARRIPIDTHGEDLDARFAFDATGPRYLGEVRVKRLSVDSTPMRPAVFDAAWKVSVERNRIAVTGAEFASGRSRIKASGAFEGFKKLRAHFDVDARLFLADVVRSVDLPVEPRGVVALKGVARFGGDPVYSFQGEMNGEGLAVNRAGVQVRDARARARVSLDPRAVALERLGVEALGGVFEGRARLEGWRRFAVAGEVRGYALEALAAARAGTPAVAWSGAVSGPVEVRGRIANRSVEEVEFDAALDISPSEGARPMEGSIELAYRQQEGTLEFGASRMKTNSTSVDFHGVLGQRLDVRLESEDLTDLLPAIAMVSGGAPRSLPVELRQGRAVFEGRVTGPIERPRIEGSARLSGFVLEGRKFERLAAEFGIDENLLAVRSLNLEQDGLAASGHGRLGLRGWHPVETGELRASVQVRGASLDKLLAAAGQAPLPVNGQVSASIEASGTIGSPQATGSISGSGLTGYGETAERLRAEFSYRDGRLSVSGGMLEVGRSPVRISGSYLHPPGDFRSGTVGFEIRSDGLPLQNFARWRQYTSELTGAATLQAVGTGWVRDGAFRLARFDAHAGVAELRLGKERLGRVMVDAATADNRLRVTASGELSGARVQLSGEWRMEGRYPGEAAVVFGPVHFSDLQPLLNPGKPLPFAGFLDGSGTFAFPLAAPGELSGEVRLAQVQLRPQDPGKPAPVRRELVLESIEPVVLAVDTKGIHVRKAQFVAAETRLGVEGTFSFQSRTPWNLRLTGGVNFALLRVFYPKLITGGKASLNAAVRGTLSKPQINGRMDLQDASVFLEDYPVGVSGAKGTVLFDSDRATIEKMTGELGGGELSLGGFVGFGGDATVFRLQAEAKRARIRYPEGVSTTADASLSLSGTADRSIVTGSITVQRAAFMPRTDMGSLLLDTSKPLGAPAAPNPVLSAMQLDVRVDSSPNLRFQTAVARDLESEIDLRLRGTLAKPVVLGEVLVNQGQIQFFGNKYTINRGEIGFFNPARIEPVLDLDLETRVRGITVTINFSGSINKLNMTYRSDPPLQPEEIVALLAVGRTPLSGLAAGQNIASQNTSFQAGANTLLGQALTAPLAGRLQRFFGVSRLKIDPLLTGVDTTPQARLTIEQQISPDITLTYVTNLSEAKQQIVRLEWDVSKQWSVVAVRDENGVFALDFLFKRRF